MNQNDYFKTTVENIGTDPSVVPVVDSLDILPSEKKGKVKKAKIPNPASGDNSSKKPSLIKKILFTCVVLLLMGTVAFGVYYYLSLGTKNAQKTAFELEDKIVYVDDELPTSITAYGNFNKVDIAKCSLNILDVNISKAGIYTYKITCGTITKSAKITVQERMIFDIATKIVYKITGSNVEAMDFIETERDDYSFAFANASQVNEYLTEAGGPYTIDIVVINEKEQELTVTALLIVTEEDAQTAMRCESDELNNNNQKYQIVDRFAFDSSKKDLNVSTRSYKYFYEDEFDFDAMKQNINNGQITIGDVTGFALIDNVNQTIEVVSSLTQETLDNEYDGSFPTRYSKISRYYRNTKKYSCSI